MFLVLPAPVPLVTSTDPELVSHESVELTKIMVAK
jgi:hypothetical protein